MKPTPQQEAFLKELNEGKESLIVEAVPGSGKTSTLVLGAQSLPGTYRVLSLAFNKHSANELSKRMPSFVECRTLNSVGYRAWAAYSNCRLQVDQSKAGRLITEKMQALDLRDRELWANSRRLMEQARTEGLVPKPCREVYTKSLVPDDDSGWETLAINAGLDYLTDNELEIARAALIKSIAEAKHGTIDFTDQLYMTVLFKAPVEQFKMVMVDEAQDLNPLQHILVERSVALRGRLIAVGDPNQAIYAWRGAYNDSMDRLQQKFKAKKLPLSVCFRCAKSIVHQAQKVYPVIQPFPDQVNGQVLHMETMQIKNLQYGDIVLCRNNAPLVKLAYQLIKQKISVKMLGRDIGGNLKSLLRRVSIQNKPASHIRNELIKRIENWTAKEIDRAEESHKNHLIDGIMDKSDSIICILEALPKEANGDEAINLINQIFESQSGKVTLSTIHRAKGLEFPTVYIYKPHLLPSRYLTKALQEQQNALDGLEGAQTELDQPSPGDHSIMEVLKRQISLTKQLLRQEDNLKYVACTRAKQTLVYVEG